jgi:hypothetical protein
MDGAQEILLTIDDLTPETITMSRLAQYMKEFSALLGHTEHIHFSKVKDGSCSLASYSDHATLPKVEKRLFLIRNDAAPNDMRLAMRNIDDMLAEDNSTGSIRNNGARVIEFLGCKRPKPEIIESVKQREFVDGELVSIGGRDETVPVHIFDASQPKYFRCNTSKEKARELAQHLFGPELRVFGESEWKRDETGTWIMKTLWIEDFCVLNQDSVTDTVKRLRAIPGNEWNQYADPIAELLKFRYGDGGED